MHSILSLLFLMKQDSRCGILEGGSAAWTRQDEEGENELQTEAPSENTGYK